MHKILPFVLPDLLLSGSVAIVGPSANLIGSKFGEIIDSHDEVIRFNRSPTKGYSIDVGTKTTLRAVNNHVFNNCEITSQGYSNSPTNFVRDLRNSNILYIGPDCGPYQNRHANTHSSNQVYLLDYSKTKSLKDLMGATHTENLLIGSIMIGLVIKSGIKPNIFGFDTEPVPRTHYYQDRPKNCSRFHNGKAEQEMIKRLNKDSVIRIYKK